MTENPTTFAKNIGEQLKIPRRIFGQNNSKHAAPHTLTDTNIIIQVRHFIRELILHSKSSMWALL